MLRARPFLGPRALQGCPRGGCKCFLGSGSLAVGWWSVTRFEGLSSMFEGPPLAVSQKNRPCAEGCWSRSGRTWPDGARRRGLVPDPLAPNRQNAGPIASHFSGFSPGLAVFRPAAAGGSGAVPPPWSHHFGDGLTNPVTHHFGDGLTNPVTHHFGDHLITLVNTACRPEFTDFQRFPSVSPPIFSHEAASRPTPGQRRTLLERTPR